MRGNQGWWAGVIISCAVVGCGQELVLPDRPTSKATDGPSQGFTGTGGASDEAETRPRLPVADQPVFTAFGGAGGEAGQPGDAGAAGDAGGSVHAPQKGGDGGRAGSAGASGTNGGKSTGGAGGAGTGSAGGSAGDAQAGAGGTSTGPAALLFSEYVEGSGSFKALEIYASEASSLEGCELLTYSNGKVEPSRLALHGELARGAVQVLCSSALATAQPNACSRSTNLTFNGDDALALSCGGRMLDAIGQIGFDPGEAWGVGATVDHTLRRRCDVLAGRSDGSTPFEIDAEWLTLGVDTFSDLGVRNCAP